MVGAGTGTLSAAFGAGIDVHPGWERARIGDRPAAFAVLLPARPCGRVVLAVSTPISDIIRRLYEDVLVLQSATPPAGKALPGKTVLWDGLHSPLAPGSAVLLVVDSRLVSVEALRPVLSPNGTLAVLGSDGDYVLYPSAERPEHVWRRDWPLPPRPGLRAQIRRSIGLRTSRIRAVPHLTVCGPSTATFADLIVAELTASTATAGCLIGIETAGHTILRVRQPGGDVAVRLSLSSMDVQVTVGELVAADVPDVRPLIPTELARGSTLGHPWIATAWIPQRRRSFFEILRGTRRRWTVATELADALQTVRTGTTGPGWSRSWADAAAFLPTEERERFAEVMAPLDGGVPTGWCHGDPWPANVVLDRYDARVIDWENATPDAPLGIDCLLIAMLREAGAGRGTVAQACTRLIDGTLTVDRRVGGRPFANWDASSRKAFAVAAFVLYLRNRSLYDMGAANLRKELDVVTAALDAMRDGSMRDAPAADQSVASRPNAGRAARGAAWLGLSAVVVKAAQTVVLLVLAAMLAPSALGLVAIATLVINVSQVLSDLGTSTALIYWRGDARRAARSAVSISVTTNALIAGGVWLAAPWIAHTLHTSADGAWVIRGLVSVLPCYGAAAAVRELLRRDLAFVRRILPDTLAAVVGAVVAVFLALHGHGIAGLVVGQIIQGVLTLLLSWVVGGVILPGIHIDDVRGLLHYGGHLAMGNLLQLALLNVDYIIVARALGETQLGQYSLAFRLAYLPYLNVAFVIAGAAFPYLCRLSGGSVGRAFERMVAVAMTALIPLCLGIALFADQLELLGTKWHPAVAIVRWLALYALLLSLAQFVQTTLNSIGRPRTTMLLQLLHFLALVPVLLVVVRHGVVAVAIGQCLVVAVKAAASLAVARHHVTGVRLRQVAADLNPAYLGAVSMTAVALVLHRALPSTLVSATGLVLVGVLASAAYLAPVALLGRGRLLRTARLIWSPS